MDRAPGEVALWRVRRAVLGLGWQGAAAIALAAFAVGFFLSAVAPLEVRVQELGAEVEALESRVGAQVPVPQLPPDPEQQLAAFHAQLASATQAPELLRQLHSLAQAAGLRLERGDYRPVVDGTTELVAYQITLPVRGAYPQVRRFLGQAMQETPGLALDGIGFQRENAGSALEAQLRFTLFLRKSA